MQIAYLKRNKLKGGILLFMNIQFWLSKPINLNNLLEKGNPKFFQKQFKIKILFNYYQVKTFKRINKQISYFVLPGGIQVQNDNESVSFGE